MLDLSDIVQIDATVIAGILILLTVTSLKITDPAKKSFTKEGLTALVVIPFAISAIFALLPSMLILSETPAYTYLASGFAIAGFVYLIGVMGKIVRASRKRT